MKKILYLICSVLFFCTCSHKKENNTNTSLNIENDSNYFFQKRYALTGVLSVEKFYGPPNYGETPDIDNIEICYLLNIQKPISILVNDSLKSDNYDENKFNQSRFHIIGFDDYQEGILVDYRE